VEGGAGGALRLLFLGSSELGASGRGEKSDVIRDQLYSTTGIGTVGAAVHLLRLPCLPVGASLALLAAW